MVIYGEGSQRNCKLS